MKVLTRSRLLPQSLYAGIRFAFLPKTPVSNAHNTPNSKFDFYPNMPTSMEFPNNPNAPPAASAASFRPRPRKRYCRSVVINDKRWRDPVSNHKHHLVLSFWTHSVAGCQNGIVQGGVCVKHGAKRRQCKFPGCDKNSKSAGLCSKHGWVYLLTVDQHLGVLVLSHLLDSICHKPLCHHHHLHHIVLLYTDPHAKSAKKKAVPT